MTNGDGQRMDPTAIRRKGGLAVLQKYGLEHFRAIAKGAPRRKRFLERRQAGGPAASAGPTVKKEGRMPNKTIYVRAGDVELWQRFEELASDNVSGALADLVRGYVGACEAHGPFGRIEVEVLDDETERTSVKAFRGRWLIDPTEKLRSRSTHRRWAWALALTEKERFVLYGRRAHSLSDSTTAAPQGTRFDVFQTVEEMTRAEPPVPPEVIARARESLAPAGSQTVEELDI